MSTRRRETLSFFSPAVLLLFSVYIATTYIVAIYGLGFAAGTFQYDLIAHITGKAYEINDLPLGRDAWGIASQGFGIMNLIIMILFGWASCVSWSGFSGARNKDSRYIAVAWVKLTKIVIGTVAVYSSIILIGSIVSWVFDRAFIMSCIGAPLTWVIAVALHQKAKEIEESIETDKFATAIFA